MVTATPTRPPADATGGATLVPRSARPDGASDRPEVAATKAAGTGRQHRPHRPRSRTSVWLGHLLDLLRLPPPLVDPTQPPPNTRPDTAAAIGVWMRHRDDPNP